MGILKLFISHSSRLDDVSHDYTSADHNWKLLENTCNGIKEKYGDRVDVLVDRDGLDVLSERHELIGFRVVCSPPHRSLITAAPIAVH